MVQLRKLQTTDLTSVARIHIRAFPKSAFGQLGEHAVFLYYDWQLNGPHDSVSLGLFKAEQLIGFCFGGIFRGALSGFLRKNKNYLILRVITHPWLLFSSKVREKINLTINLLKPRKKNQLATRIIIERKPFGILSIAIDPDYQRLGYGNQLLMEAEKNAREKNFSEMHLSVDIQNSNAIDFYQKTGWTKIVNESENWHGSMRKNLENIV